MCPQQLRVGQQDGIWRVMQKEDEAPGQPDGGTDIWGLLEESAQ